MNPKYDLHGKTFGRLRVVSFAGSRKTSKNGSKNRFWKCLCECGNSGDWPYIFLVTGKTKSCGCLAKESLQKSKFRHGDRINGRQSPLYSKYMAMISRCENPSNTNYHYYGGRGISVCRRWRKGAGDKTGFECFRDDMGQPIGDANTLDRINSDGNYEPGNVRWATRRQQVINRRNVYMIRRSDGAVFPTIVDAAKSVSVSPSSVRAQIAGRCKTSAGYTWEKIYD